MFGEGLPGSKPPDFTKIPGIRASTPRLPLPRTPEQRPRTTEPRPQVAHPSPKLRLHQLAASAPTAAAPKPKPNPRPHSGNRPDRCRSGRRSAAGSQNRQARETARAAVVSPAVPRIRQSMTEYTERLLTSPSRKDKGRPPAAGLADRHPSDRHPVPGLCPALRSVSVLSGIAAADHGSFRPEPPGPDRRRFSMACPSGWRRIRCRISPSECSASSRPW